MEQAAGRRVTVLVTFGTERLTVGFEVATPRWHDVAPVARELEARLGVPAPVLRLLSVVGGEDGQGGHATYHAEALRRPSKVAPTASAAECPPDGQRADWATAEGLRSALGWAEEALRASGRAPVGPVEQVKTWNLSGLFRFPTASGPAWLKTTPHFGACEAQVIGLFGSVDATLVPTVLASDTAARRVLLDHVPGKDCWGAPEDSMLTAVERLVAAQAALAGHRADTLTDRTPRVLTDRVRELLAGEAGRELSVEELEQAHRMVEQLPRTVEELEACGLPETVVHGDFHPGNWRSDGRSTVVVDFSDSYLGHPAFDGLRPRAFLSEARWARVRELWTRAWAAQVPGSDPGRALEVAEPLVHLAYAVRYQEFLDGIEASERIYHEGDPASELRCAIASFSRS